MPVILLAAAAAFWIVTREEGNDDPDPKPQTGFPRPEVVSGTNGKDPADSQSLNNGNGTQLPADPVEGIALLSSTYSGAKLGAKLWEAGRAYARSSPEDAKKFILAVPVGSVGEMALKGVAQAIPANDRPGFFQFFRDNSQALGEQMTARALEDMLDRWGADDTAGGMSFLLGLSAPMSDKTAWLKNLFEAAPADDALLTMVRNLPEDLRPALTSSFAYVNASLQRQSFAVFDEMQVSGSEPNLVSTIARAMEKAPDQARTIDALRQSKLPVKEEVAAAAVGRWLARDTNAALTYLDGSGDRTLVDAVISSSWETIARHDPGAAEAWIAKIDDPARRLQVSNLLKQHQK